MRTTIWAALAALISSPVTAGEVNPMLSTDMTDEPQVQLEWHYPTCHSIVRDDDVTYWHGVAHCNGWMHERWVLGERPPAEFVHAYPGHLDVIITANQVLFNI